MQNSFVLIACQHHELCDRITPPKPKLRQRTLTIINGLLSLGPPPGPPVRPLRRTPAGKAIRNIANIPKWSTTDPSLTTFLRFPPEVRLQIYGYLLISVETVQREICPVKLCLVERSWQPRLRIFPAILECCRKINEEGSAVLYGKNLFEVESHTRHYSTAATWSPARVNLLSITWLNLTYIPGCECFQDRKMLSIMDRFPALRGVMIRLSDVLVEEWETFLKDVCEGFQRMKRFILDIHVNDTAGGVIYRQWRGSSMTDEEMCLRTYQGPFWKQQDIWKNRGVSWKFERETDSFSRDHGVLGSLKVFVE
ncbi:hypothetical protein N431DRAFT_431294 [Stipitochalara longipes BDJ]|nr:hypothetical protein N431DRAFT_431294 [Stipitochalara longipes BDJ]